MRTNESLVVFLVDDDPVFQAALQEYLRNAFGEDMHLYCFSGLNDCLPNLYLKPCFIILAENADLKAGKEMLGKLKHQHAEVNVVVVSAQLDLELAIDLIKNGASDYLVKNEEAFRKIRNLVRAASSDGARVSGKQGRKMLVAGPEKGPAEPLPYHPKASIYFAPFIWRTFKFQGYVYPKKKKKSQAGIPVLRALNP